MKKLVVLAVAAFVLCVFRRDAHACGSGSYGLDGLAYVAAAGAVVVGTVGIIDTTYTVYDSVHAPPSNPPSTGWTKAQSWVASPQAILGALIAVQFPIDAKPEWGDSFSTALAFTAWPTALMAHGIWATNVRTYGDAWQTPVAVVGVVDGALGAYDVVQLARGRHPDTLYSVAELVGALPQTAFGFVYSARASGTDLRNAMLCTSLPALLSLHAILELAIPQREASSSSGTRTSTSMSTGTSSAVSLSSVAPSFVVQGARGPAPGVAISGLF